MLRSSPPPSYHELPKRANPSCRLLSLNRWERIRNQLEKFDRCMLGCMATLLFILGSLIYLAIALSPLIIFILVRSYLTTLELSVIPSALNSSIILTPHSFSSGVGYFLPDEAYLTAKFHVPIRFQFPAATEDRTQVKSIQVQLYSVNGTFVGGGERSPSEHIEVPWIEEEGEGEVVAAALPVEIVVREQDGALSCLHAESPLSLEAAVSVNLVADSWLSRRSGILKFTQDISLCCECIFPQRRDAGTQSERTQSPSVLKTRKHRLLRNVL